MTRALLVILAIAGFGLAVMRAFPGSPFGIDRLWAAFGPADQGAVDFTRLARRVSPNDALACPPGLCAAAVPDIVSPVWDVPYHELRERLRTAVLATKGEAVQVAEAIPGRGDRFVVRTPLMRFPDTVDVMVLPAEGGKSTVAIYSRSLIGRSDLGANLARIKGWLGDPAVAAGSHPRPAQP